MVPTARLELARLSSLPPQDSVSTNFTTSALQGMFQEHAEELISAYLGIAPDLSNSTGACTGADCGATGCTAGLAASLFWLEK